MYDSILLPTDGNPRTPQVVRHALNVAELTDGCVHVVSVVTSNGTDEADASAAIESALSFADERDVPTETAILEGRPYEEILEYAEEVAVDLIVMGTHGRSGLDRFMIGSVTERVLRTSDVPVLAVRLGAEEPTVTDADAAVEAARSTLEDAGHAVAAIPERPYRESNSWIVRVETEDGDLYNVHVAVENGETSLAEIRS